MKIVIASLIALLLQGCWFVYIPGSALSAVADGISGNEGTWCVGETTPVGRRVKRANGMAGTVTKLEGTSSRCQDPAAPIRAVVKEDS